MVISKTFYFYVFIIMGSQYKITLNKFESQKQALRASTWINVSTAMALLTSRRSFSDFHIIGK